MTETLLSIEDLSVTFHQGHESSNVVDRVNLSLHQGKTLALVGESGSGKSVTAHSVLKLLPYPMASHPHGRILYRGSNLLELDEQEIRSIRGNKIGMIFQEPMTALNPLQRVEKQIGEVLLEHGENSRESIREKVLDLLTLVKIPDPEQKLRAFPHELSGGQRQRVMIAMALANQPEILIADEPTTALDVTVQREILELLKSLQKEQQLSLLLITHDLGVVQHMADEVAVMKNGQILETQSVRQLFSSPTQPYTQSLLNAAPSGRPTTVVSASATVLLSAKDLKVNYTLKKTLFGKPKVQLAAVKNANLELRPGETLGIVGESGSGKSTLALALLRLIESEGTIVFDAQKISSVAENQLRHLRSRLQVVFQDPFASLSPRMTISEIIGEGLKIHSTLSPHKLREKVIKTMTEVGLDPQSRHRYPHEFSGGQRQRVAIARALILDPALIVLDEPTSALDRAVQSQVIELLRELQTKRGLSYLFISHDLKVVQAVSHRVMVMKDGEIVECGNAEQILKKPQHEYTKNLIAASF